MAQAATADNLFGFSEQWHEQSNHHAQNRLSSTTTSVYSLGAVQQSGSSANAFYSNPAKGIYYSNRVIVLVFHDLSKTLHSRWNMSPSTFAAELKTLQDNHFHVVSNQQFTGWLEHQNSVPDNAVLLTFDDGYASWYSHALPTLLQNHMTGTFFNIVGFIDMNRPGFLTWPEAVTMAHDGMSMESHTYNLHYLVKVNGYPVPAFNTPLTNSGKILTPAQYYERDLQDFSKAQSVLQAHTGTVVNQFAWPYGFGNAVSMSAALHSGYRFIYTTMPGIVTPWTNPLYIPRIDVGLSFSTPQVMMERIFQTAGVPLPSAFKL